MFQHELYDTNEKLTKLVALQAAELQALRETMCTACKQRYAALSPSTRPLSYDSTLVDETTSLFQMPKMKGFWQTLGSCSSYLSINEAITSISNSLAEISTDQCTENNDQTFCAQQDDLAYTAVDVEFSQSFCLEEHFIPSMCSSRDGSYSAFSSSCPPIDETTPSIEPKFYARKDDLADTTFEVGFEHSFRHEKTEATSLCFSCDGGHLAVAIAEGRQGSIVIYEMESCAKYCEMKEYASQYGSSKRPRICSLCFSANGRYLAAGDTDHRVIIWDIPNRRIRSIFQDDYDDFISKLRFSPDGRLVAFCAYSELVVLNVRDNSRKMASWCSCFDFNPNGRHIATGNYNGDLAILEVRTGTEVKRWNVHGTLVDRVIFTSDGKRLLCSYGGVTEHWDLNEVDPVLIWKSVADSYLYAISPDNRLFVRSNELWDVNSGKRQCSVEGHIGHIYSESVCFSAAGNCLAMGGWDGVVSLWKYAWT